MILDPGIEKYLCELLPVRDDLLREMEEEAARRRIPIVGPVVGNLLAVLARAAGARRVFELGSAIGYSTLWLARAVPEGGEVHYTDLSETNAGQARSYFERAGIYDKISIHVGDALRSLRETPGDFDVIFNDIEKEGYPAVLEEAPQRLRRGGLLITDNALWSGRVLSPEDAAARAVAEFNRRLFQSPEFLTSLVPIRDGVAVAVKL